MPANPRLRGQAIAMVAVAAIMFAISMAAFHQQTFGTKLSDIPTHLQAVMNSTRTGVWPSYSILFVLLHGLSLGSQNPVVLGYVAIVLLSSLIALKSVLTYQNLAIRSMSPFAAAGIAASLAFVQPIMNWWNHWVIVGQIPPNAWHNSTSVLAMPVVILLFYASLRSVEAPTLKTSALVSTLIVLSVITKPNYILAMLPVFALFFLYAAVVRQGLGLLRTSGHLIVMLVPALAVLVIQYVLTFGSSEATTHIILAPLQVWQKYSPHPAISFVLSAAFPLAFAALYRERWNTRFLYAWAVFGVAALQAVLLAEEGARFHAGNFFWGANMALYVLFLVTADLFFRSPFTARAAPVLMLFLLHLASGLYVFARIVAGLGYN
jgi:hypothetical protein